MEDLKKRAENGEAAAQSEWAASLFMAEPPDYAEAAKWLRKAADQGDLGAQSNLGILYLHGEGVTQDFAAAIRLFQGAADQGIASAQANLGNCYANGSGVPQDWAEAYFWWSVSFEGNEGAELLSEAAEYLTPDQKADVNKRIANWKTGK